MGLMIRFSAGKDEVGALLRFLRRRAPHERLYFAPLPDGQRRRSGKAATGAGRHFRRTERPLLRQLETQRGAINWGIFTTADAPDERTFAPPLLALYLSDADRFGRRDGILEARDEIGGDPPDYTPRCRLCRDLALRCARRIRHRGTSEKGRWTLPL